MGRRKWSQILERPTDYDTIYDWSMRIGPVEIRKWSESSYRHLQWLAQGSSRQHDATTTID